MMDYGFDALSVHVLVDLSDPESVVGIKAVAEWARDQDQAVRIWPFLREPINTAAEVPKGPPSFEAYKARRGLARRRYKDQERQRNVQRLSLSQAWTFTDAGATLVHWGLLRLAEHGASATTISPFILGLVSSNEVLDTGFVQAALLDVMPPLVGEMRGFDQAAAKAELAERSRVLSELGVLSAPSMMYQAEVFSGMAHLPRLTALCRR
jgi:2-hydroxychromene-2-carboxylate isomerase